MAGKFNRLFALLLALSLLLAGCAGKQEEVDPGEAVAWSDPAMEWAVRAELDKPEGVIYTGELRFIQIVVIRDSFVQFNNGTVHSLEGDPVAGLGDVISFARLAKLHLSKSSVADLSPVAECSALQQLSLYYCPNIEDLSPAVDLKKLVVLEVVGCPVKDYAPVEKMTGLVELAIEGAGLTALDLGGLPALRRLRLPGNKIEDLSFLGGREKLIELDLRNNRLEDLSLLEGISLQILRVGKNPIGGEIAPLAGMDRLIELDLSGCGVTDLAPLEKLTLLETLDCSGGSVTSLSPLGKLTALKVLNVADNQIASVSSLQPLVKLRELDLSGNRIADAAPLAKLKELRKLNLTGCGISKTETESLNKALGGCEIIL